MDWRPDYVRELPGAPRWFVDASPDLTGQLGTLAVPTLLLWAGDDPLSPPGVGELLRERIPGARLVVLPGGHDLAERSPGPVAAAIRSHLAG